MSDETSLNPAPSHGPVKVGAVGFALLVVVAAAFFGGRASVDRAVPRAAIATGAASAPATTRTTVEVFAPWQANDSLSSGVTVTKRLSGTCWTGSIAVDDPQVWRCMSGNNILDPCFAAEDGTTTSQLACDPQPWNGKLILLHLTSALPMSEANPANSSNNPSSGWAIQLGNGDKCFVSTGANGEVDGVLIVYYCDSGNSAGQLNEHRQPWTVEYVRRGADVIEPVNVIVAWAG